MRKLPRRVALFVLGVLPAAVAFGGGSGAEALSCPRAPGAPIRRDPVRAERLGRWAARMPRLELEARGTERRAVAYGRTGAGVLVPYATGRQRGTWLVAVRIGWGAGIPSRAALPAWGVVPVWATDFGWGAPLWGSGEAFPAWEGVRPWGEAAPRGTGARDPAVGALIGGRRSARPARPLAATDPDVERARLLALRDAVLARAAAAPGASLLERVGWELDVREVAARVAVLCPGWSR